MAAQYVMENLRWPASGNILKEIYNRLGFATDQHDHLSRTASEQAKTCQDPVAASKVPPTEPPELGEDFLCDLRTVVRCAKMISTYTSEIESIDNELAELEQSCMEMKEQLQLLPGDEDRSLQLRGLQMGKVIATGHSARREELVKKLNQMMKDIASPREAFWPNLEEVLVQHQLVPISSEIPDFQAPDFQEPDAQVPSSTIPHEVEANSTPSQNHNSHVERAEAGPVVLAQDERNALDQQAWEAVMFADSALQEARSKFDNWPIIYAQQYEAYRQLYEAGVVDDNKTQFDLTLFAEEKQVGQELIKAEEDAKAAHTRARELGICILQSQYEDQHEGQLEDSDLLSLDPDWAERVDHGKIQNWLSDNPQNTSPDDSDLARDIAEGDDWGDDLSLDFGESNSIWAVGEEREEIDRWRSMCYEGAQGKS
jgi:hypothetical protein